MVRRVLIVLLVFVAASVDILALQVAAAAMDCCAGTDYECAGIQPPDDCCQNMGHGVAISATTIPQPRLALSPPVVATLANVTPPVDACDYVLSHDAFKRPHDPPHLHPSPLLI